MEPLKIKKGDLPSYELNVLRSGLCSALLSASFYAEGELFFIYYDDCGCSSLQDHFSCHGERILDSFSCVLALLRSVLEAVQLADRYLIRSEDLSFDADDLHFESGGKARLLLKPDPETRGQTLSDRVLHLCYEIQKRYPFTNCDVISERITQENAKGKLDASRLLRLFSLWQMELND